MFYSIHTYSLYYEMITIVKLLNVTVTIHTWSPSVCVWWAHLSIVLGNFRYTLLVTINDKLYIRFPELIHPITEDLCSLISISLFPLPLEFLVITCYFLVLWVQLFGFNIQVVTDLQCFQLRIFLFYDSPKVICLR